jgi:hypothetical protein
VERVSEALAAKQDLLVGMLLSGRGLAESAEELGVHRSTCWRWLRDPRVQAELRKGRAELQSAARAGLVAASLEAVRYLRQVVSDPGASVNARLRAACAVLDRCGVSKGAEGLEDWHRKEERREMLGDWGV